MDEITGQIITNSPRHLARFDARVALFSRKLSVGLDGYYNSSRPTVSGLATNSFFVTNLTVYSRTLHPNWELSASVYNLFDEDYAHPGSEEHTQDMLAQDGRSFRIRVAYLLGRR